LERDVGDGAVEAVDPHEHGLAGVTAPALDRQIHIARRRVHRHVRDDHVAGPAAEERTDTHVHVLQVERLWPSLWAGVANVDCEHRGRDVVGQEQDPGRAERDRAR
jgi:hypothetical protein